MKITWLGHASFLIESKNGTRIITDPFEAGSYEGAVGYAPISERADIVTVSHDHADHNAVDAVTGTPEVVRGTEPRTVADVSIRGFSTYHDESRGQERGRNTIYVMEVDGLKVGHLGDLGHELTEDEASEIGSVDVLLAPIGGYYTIGPEEAKKAAEALGFPMQPVDDFLKLMEHVDRVGSRSVEVDPDSLPDPSQVVVLDYE